MKDGKGTWVKVADGHQSDATMYNRFGFIFDRSLQAFVDLKGKQALSPVTFYREPDNLVEGLFRFHQNGKLGFGTECMSVAIPPIFDFATSFRNGLSLVCTNCHIEITVPQRYPNTTGDWNLVRKDGSKVFSTDQYFDIAKSKFDEHSAQMPRLSFSNNKLRMGYGNKGPGDENWEYVLAGVLDNKNQWVMPPQLSIHFGEYTDYSIYASLYLIDLRGERRLEPYLNDNGPHRPSEGLFRFVENGKIGFANEKLDIVIEAQFKHVWSFKNGYAIFCNDCQYEEMGEYTNVTSNNWGAIDKAGKVIFEPEYALRALKELIENSP